MPAPPSPCNTAYSEGFGSSRVLSGSSSITSPRLRRKRTRSQGPSLHRRHPASSVLWPCPTPARTGARGAVEAAILIQRGAPPLPDSPFRRAKPLTPADRKSAHVDCFPIRAAFPEIQAGRHPRHHFRGLLRLHSRYGPSDRSTAKAAFVTRLRPGQLPGPTARQLPDLSTTIWVVSSSTGDTRPFGAHSDIRGNVGVVPDVAALIWATFPALSLRFPLIDP